MRVAAYPAHITSALSAQDTAALGTKHACCSDVQQSCRGMQRAEQHSAVSGRSMPKIICTEELFLRMDL